MFYISNCTGGVGRHNDNDLKQIVVQGVHKMRLKTIRLHALALPNGKLSNNFF